MGVFFVLLNLFTYMEFTSIYLNALIFIYMTKYRRMLLFKPSGNMSGGSQLSCASGSAGESAGRAIPPCFPS